MEELKHILKTEKWLNDAEIFSLLQGVEYIILAQPNFADKPRTTSHFTIFFNTQELLPSEVIEPILEKFAQENTLYDIEAFHHTLGNVAFAKTNQDTPMPYFIDPQALDTALEDAGSIKMYLFDFNANFKEGFEKTLEGLSGWSFVKN